MDASTVTVLIVILLLALVVAFFLQRQRKRSHLRERFGPEYDTAVQQAGSRRRAEEDLAQRERRHEQLQLRELPAERAEWYAGEWARVQQAFVDQPREAVAAADRLVTDLMRERGYPAGSFEQKAADLSVEHAGVLDQFRYAHEIAGRDSQGQATTEELREAMQGYRAAAEALLASGTGRHRGSPEQPPPRTA